MFVVSIFLSALTFARISLCSPVPNPGRGAPSNSVLEGAPLLDTIVHNFDHHDREPSSYNNGEGHSDAYTYNYRRSKTVGAVAETARSKSYNQDGTSQSALEQFYAKSQAQASASRVQVGADAEAGLANVEYRNSVVRGFARGPAVGAGVGAGLTTGVGVRATVGEAGGDIGGIIGGKVGLSADTGVSIGTTTEAKILGSGVKIDFTKGVEFCLFGSCFFIG